MEDTYLTINEVADMLRIHKNTAYTWFKREVFPNAIEFDGIKRIPLSDIENLKVSNRKKA